MGHPSVKGETWMKKEGKGTGNTYTSKRGGACSRHRQV